MNAFMSAVRDFVMKSFTLATLVATIATLTTATPFGGIAPVKELDKQLPMPLQLAGRAAGVVAQQFSGCDEVRGTSCQDRFTTLVEGGNMLWHEQLFIHYLHGNGETVNEVPEHLHGDIRAICSASEAVEARKSNRIQVSSYGQLNKELNYSLGSFGCQEVGTNYLITDVWKVDPGKNSDEDDLQEGGIAAHTLVSTYCRKPGGCKAFLIKATVPK